MAYLSGKATEEELRKLEEWILADPENEHSFQEARNIWHGMHPAFNPDEIDVKKGELQVISRIRKPDKLRVLVQYWQRVAAILVVPLLLLSAYLLTERQDNANDLMHYQEIKSPYGTFSQIDLPDGTQVWLNGGSTLKYPLKFTQGKRDVYLSGEGYFEVHSDKENPFIVTTSRMVLKATGTAFNVEAYTNDSTTAVTMVNGRIDVSFGNAPITMQIGQRLCFDHTTLQPTLIHTDPYKWYAWKDGLMIFRDDPLSYVFKRLGQAFNVEIVVKDPGIANASYRATFEDEPLEEILRLLEMTAPIHFKLEPRNQSANNRFAKQRIEVYRR